MKNDNVVPFDPRRRGGVARRGAADKHERSKTGTVTLNCPTCAAALRLETRWLEDEAELLCARCEAEIPLVTSRQVVR